MLQIGDRVQDLLNKNRTGKILEYSEYFEHTYYVQWDNGRRGYVPVEELKEIADPNNILKELVNE